MDTGTAGMTDERDTAFELVVRLLAMAARELDRHTPADGLCQACGSVWPCATCRQADLALASQ